MCNFIAQLANTVAEKIQIAQIPKFKCYLNFDSVLTLCYLIMKQKVKDGVEVSKSKTFHWNLYQLAKLNKITIGKVYTIYN